jgi:DNA-binding beta-propeller fold protein YncE
MLKPCLRSFIALSLAAGALVAQNAPRAVPALAGVPQFEPDLNWPTKPEGFRWGQVIGIFADARGHVWTSTQNRVYEWDQNGKNVQSWDARGPDGNWNTIHGMFVDHNGFVWTNARESNLTVKFTRDGKVAMIIGKYNETGGSNDTTLMGRPSEIWVDPTDNEVFVADGYGNRRVVVFDGATGKYLRHWGAYGRRPEDPAGRGGRGGAAGAGGRGAADTTGGRGGRGGGGRGGRAGGDSAGRGGGVGLGGGGRAGDIARPNGAGGPAAQALAPGRGSMANPDTTPAAAEPARQFSIPHGIVGSRDGLIYLADRANNRIQVFRQSGEYVAEKILRPRCGGQQQAAWAPKRPCGIEATFSVGFSHDGPQTYLYSADGGTHAITILRRSDLEIVGEFGTPGVGPGQLGRPHNLTVDPAGNIYVAEAAGPLVRDPASGDSVAAGFRAQKFRFTGVKR